MYYDWSTKVIASPDPYNYTSGRWLRQDVLQWDARIVQFDFDALCRRVVALCPGARSITSVFIFYTDDGKRVVARLPFPLAGAQRLTTNSEAATIKFLQAETSIPIQSILEWSDDASISIGSEYIIMEHAPGISSHEKWPTMCGKLNDLNFPAYTPYLTTPKLSSNQEFCIGPDLAAHCNGLIDAGISRLPPAGSFPKRPRYYGSIETHHRLLEYGRAVKSRMAEDPRVRQAAAPEYPTVISAIIDCIELAFWYADEDRTQSEACAKAFDVSIRILAPKLSAARSMDEALFGPFRYCYRTWEDGAVVFREELIQTSLHWKELGFAEPCPFPLPSPDEILTHQKDYKLFEDAQQLKHGLSGPLNSSSDGWVPSEHWESTELAHQETFEGMRREILGNEQPDQDEPIKDEDDLGEIWPFDLKE
ncbi:hypothetical protein BU23DRAFT_585168 [Bimuria novae-zelandiae CBS 107.79]|uniref:Altered inheritance of mitochondria protein 9, mitochondrial n=1 Tax=Bimuria novae-zelandiae CBS 107.79 TaxID=1447943 RepID=A0A6A5UQC4_9PLEO|nr:hypothetical protein BU23DRAFT_585168 [Bimuria novae-zelandiae CBS 107.79]